MTRARPQVRRASLRIARVLTPTDFSPAVEPALQWAMRLADAFGAEVTLLHVLDPSLGAVAGLPAHLAAMPAYGELLDVVRGEARDEMAKLGRRYPSAKTVIREGPPRSIIMEVAGEIKAGLIIMGTHGRTGLAHVFFGSVAEHVVRHSRIPVLTVRQHET